MRQNRKRIKRVSNQYYKFEMIINHQKIPDPFVMPQLFAFAWMVALPVAATPLEYFPMWCYYVREGDNRTIKQENVINYIYHYIHIVQCQ